MHRKRIHLSLQVFITLGILCTLVSADAYASGTWKALVIGIGDYSDSRIKDLKTPVLDGKELADVLSYQYGFEVTTLFDGEATWHNIDGALRKFISETMADDSVLIYYGGHGDLDRELDEGWWYPVDTEPGNRQTYLQNSDLRELIKKMEARHVLLVSDSCFAASLFGDYRSLSTKIDDRYHERLYKSKSRLGLTSGGKEPVLDGGSKDHSIFAYHLLKYLKTTEREVFSVGELFTEIAPIITNNSPQKPEFLPILYTGHESGEFIFVRNGNDSINYAPSQTLTQKKGALLQHIDQQIILICAAITLVALLLFFLVPKTVQRQRDSKLRHAIARRDVQAVRELISKNEPMDRQLLEAVDQLTGPVKGVILDNVRQKIVIAPGPRQGLGRGGRWVFSISDPHVSRKPHGWIGLSDSGLTVNKDGGTIKINNREEVSKTLQLGDTLAMGPITTVTVEKLVPGVAALLQVGGGPEQGKILACIERGIDLDWLLDQTQASGKLYWEEGRPCIDSSEGDNHPLPVLRDRAICPLVNGDVLRLGEQDWMVTLL